MRRRHTTTDSVCYLRALGFTSVEGVGRFESEQYLLERREDDSDAPWRLLPLRPITPGLEERQLPGDLAIAHAFAFIRAGRIPDESRGAPAGRKMKRQAKSAVQQASGQRIVRFLPAFDKRSPDPSKNYGVGGVGIYFVLKGAQGAVVLELLTPWMLPQVEKWHEALAEARPSLLRAYSNATAGNLQFHSPVELPDSRQSTGACNWLGMDHCWVVAGSFLAGDQAYLRLKTEGDEGLWAELQAFYDEIVRPGAK